ncbi:UNVERIFIED_CONTAM: hypothetical protein HHA_289520 [Hammondia hammondi]|eukprot:XP_008889122.1 hypothetical protein HHA_289520 [Hammondia hammondi]
METREGGDWGSLPPSGLETERARQEREEEKKRILEEILQQDLSDDEELDRLILGSTRSHADRDGRGRQTSRGLARVSSQAGAAEPVTLANFADTEWAEGGGGGRRQGTATHCSEVSVHPTQPSSRAQAPGLSGRVDAEARASEEPISVSSSSPSIAGFQKEKEAMGREGDVTAGRLARTTRTVEEILNAIEEEEEEDWLSTLLLPQSSDAETSCNALAGGAFSPSDGEMLLPARGREGREDERDPGRRPFSQLPVQVPRPDFAHPWCASRASQAPGEAPLAGDACSLRTENVEAGHQAAGLPKKAVSSFSSLSPSHRASKTRRFSTKTETSDTSSSLSRISGSRSWSRSPSQLSDSEASSLAGDPLRLAPARRRRNRQARRTRGLLSSITSPFLPSSRVASLRLLADAPLQWTCREHAVTWGGQAALAAALALAEEGDGDKGQEEKERKKGIFFGRREGDDDFDSCPRRVRRGQRRRGEKEREKPIIPEPLEQAAVERLLPEARASDDALQLEGGRDTCDKEIGARDTPDSPLTRQTEESRAAQQVHTVQAPRHTAMGPFDAVAQGFASLQSLVASVGIPTCFDSSQSLLAIGTSRGFALLVDVHALPVAPDHDPRRGFFASFFSSPEAFPLFLPPPSQPPRASPSSSSSSSSGGLAPSSFLSLSLGEISATGAPEEEKLGAVSSISLADSLRFLLVGYKSGAVALYEIHATKAQRQQVPPGCTYTPACPREGGEAEALLAAKAEPRVPLLRGYQASLLALSKEGGSVSLTSSAESEQATGSEACRAHMGPQGSSNSRADAKKENKSSSVCCLRFISLGARGEPGGRGAASQGGASAPSPASSYGASMWPVPSLGRASVLPSGALAVALAADERGDLFVLSFQKAFLSVACERRFVTPGIQTLGAILDIRVLPPPPAPDASAWGLPGPSAPAASGSALERGLRALPLLGRGVPGDEQASPRPKNWGEEAASAPETACRLAHPADEAQVVAVACSNAVLLLALLPQPSLVFRLDLLSGSLRLALPGSGSKAPAEGVSSRAAPNEEPPPVGRQAPRQAEPRSLCSSSFSSVESGAFQGREGEARRETRLGRTRDERTSEEDASPGAKQLQQTALPDLPCIAWLRAAVHRKRFFNDPVVAVGLSNEVRLFALRTPRAPRLGADGGPEQPAEGNSALLVEPGSRVFSFEHRIQSLQGIGDSILCIMNSINVLGFFQLVQRPSPTTSSSSSSPFSVVELMLLQQVDVSLANPVYYRFTDVSLISQLVRQQREKQREERASSPASLSDTRGGWSWGLLGGEKGARHRLLFGAKRPGDVGARARDAEEAHAGQSDGRGRAEVAPEALPVFAASYANSLSLGYGGVSREKTLLADVFFSGEDGDGGATDLRDRDEKDARRERRRCPGDEGATEILVVGLEGLVVVRLRSWLEIVEELLAEGRGLEVLSVLKCLYDGRLPPLCSFSSNFLVRKQAASLSLLASSLLRSFCLSTLRNRRILSSLLPSLLPSLSPFLPSSEAASIAAPSGDLLWLALVRLLAFCAFELTVKLQLYPLLNGVVFRSFWKLLDELDGADERASPRVPGSAPAGSASKEEPSGAVSPLPPGVSLGDTLRQIFFSLLVRYLVLGKLPPGAVDPGVLTALFPHFEAQLELAVQALEHDEDADETPQALEAGGDKRGDRNERDTDVKDITEVGRKEERSGEGREDEEAEKGGPFPSRLLWALTRLVGADAAAEESLLASLLEVERAWRLSGAVQTGDRTREVLERKDGEGPSATEKENGTSRIQLTADGGHACGERFSLLPQLYVHLTGAEAPANGKARQAGRRAEQRLRQNLLKYRLLRQLLQFVLMRLFGVPMRRQLDEIRSDGKEVEGALLCDESAEGELPAEDASLAGAVDLLQVLQLVSVHRMWLGVCLTYSRAFADFRTPVELLMGDAYRLQYVIFKKFILWLQTALSSSSASSGTSEKPQGEATDLGPGDTWAACVGSVGSLPLFVPPRDVANLRATRELFFFLFSVSLDLPYPLHAGGSRRASSFLVDSDPGLNANQLPSRSQPVSCAEKRTVDLLWREGSCCGLVHQVYVQRAAGPVTPPFRGQASPLSPGLCSVLEYVFRRPSVTHEALKRRLDFLFSAPSGGRPVHRVFVEAESEEPRQLEPPGWASPQIFKRLFMMAPRMVFQLFSALLLAHATSRTASAAALGLSDAASHARSADAEPRREGEGENGEKRDDTLSLANLLLPAVADCIVDAAAQHKAYAAVLDSITAAHADPAKGDRGTERPSPSGSSCSPSGGGFSLASPSAKEGVACLRQLTGELRETVREMHGVLWRLLLVGFFALRGWLPPVSSLRRALLRFLVFDAPPTLSLLRLLLSQPLAELEEKQLSSLLLTTPDRSDTLSTGIRPDPHSLQDPHTASSSSSPSCSPSCSSPSRSPSCSSCSLCGSWSAWDRETLLLAVLDREAEEARQWARRWREDEGQEIRRALQLYASDKELLASRGFLRAAALLYEAEGDYDRSLDLWIRAGALRAGTAGAESLQGPSDAVGRGDTGGRGDSDDDRGSHEGGSPRQKGKKRPDEEGVFFYIRALLLRTQPSTSALLSREEGETEGDGDSSLTWRVGLLDLRRFLHAVSRHLPQLVELNCTKSARLICEIFRVQQALSEAEARGPEGVTSEKGKAACSIETGPALFRSPSAIVDLLDAHPKLQLQFLEALMSQSDEEPTSSSGGSSFFVSLAEQRTFIHSQLVRYIRLLCQHEPRRVCLVLQQQERLPLAACLRVCEEFQVLDACAYLLERTGDFQGIVRLFQQSFARGLDRLRALFLTPDFSILPLLRALLPRYPPSHPIHGLASAFGEDGRASSLFRSSSGADEDGRSCLALHSSSNESKKFGAQLRGRAVHAARRGLAEADRLPPMLLPSGVRVSRGEDLHPVFAPAREGPPEELADLLPSFSRGHGGEEAGRAPLASGAAGVYRRESDARKRETRVPQAFTFDEEPGRQPFWWSDMEEVGSLFELVETANWVGSRNAHLLQKQQLEDLWFGLLTLVVHAQQAFPQLLNSTSSASASDASGSVATPQSVSEAVERRAERGGEGAGRGKDHRKGARKTLRGLLYELVLSELLSAILHAGVMTIASLPETLKRITKTHRHIQLAVFKRPLASMLSGLSYQQTLLDAYSSLANADTSALFSRVEASRRRGIAIKVVSAGNAVSSAHATLTCSACHGHLLLPPPPGVHASLLASRASRSLTSSRFTRKTLLRVSGAGGAQAYYAATSRGDGGARVFCRSPEKNRQSDRQTSAIAAFPCGHLFHFACLQEGENPLEISPCSACVALDLGLGWSVRDPHRARPSGRGTFEE